MDFRFQKLRYRHRCGKEYLWRVCLEKYFSVPKNALLWRKVNLSGGKNSVGITISNKAARKFIFN